MSRRDPFDAAKIASLAAISPTAALVIPFLPLGKQEPFMIALTATQKISFYMIHCLRCNKQYIGEMKRRLKDRFNEHRRPVDRPTPFSRPTAVSDYFLSDNHSPNDIELVPLELIHSSRDALRKATEAYLIERGQTLEPKSINKREEI